MNIPKEIQDKIDYQIDRTDPTWDGLIKLATYAYSLSQSELAEKDKEIYLLKQAVLKTDYRSEIETQLTEANKRIEELEEPLRSIAEEKYPESVFKPISDEDFKSIKNYCEQILYIPLDRISAHYGRIFQKIFSDVAKEALK